MTRGIAVEDVVTFFRGLFCWSGLQEDLRLIVRALWFLKPYGERAKSSVQLIDYENAHTGGTEPLCCLVPGGMHDQNILK